MIQSFNENNENNENNGEICRGRKPVMDLLTNNPSRCAKLIIANNVRPPFLDEIVDLAKSKKVTYQLAAPEALDKLSGGEKHQGVICRLTQAKTLELDDFLRELDDKAPVLVVILDHIEDPHNLGAIIRSAEAGGASAVIHAKRRSAIPNGTVIKTSAGASLRLPVIQVVNISRTIERLKESGFWAVGLSEKSERSIWNEKFPERCALVVGAEGSGLSRLVREMCDMTSRIPIKGGVGSLNASVAAALGIFEWARTYGD